jgi:hypothetical protein
MQRMPSARGPLYQGPLCQVPARAGKETEMAKCKECKKLKATLKIKKQLIKGQMLAILRLDDQIQELRRQLRREE